MDKKNRKIQYLGIHTMNITFFQRFANLDDEPFVTKKGRIAAVLFYALDPSCPIANAPGLLRMT